MQDGKPKKNGMIIGLLFAVIVAAVCAYVANADKKEGVTESSAEDKTDGGTF